MRIFHGPAQLPFRELQKSVPRDPLESSAAAKRSGANKNPDSNWTKNWKFPINIYIYIVGFKINSSNWGFKRRKRSKGDLTKITIHVIMLQPMIDGNSC